MDPTLVGIIGFIILFILIFVFNMPIAFAMALIGFIGMWSIGGINAALGNLGIIPYSTVATYVMCVIPAFLLLGEFSFVSGAMADAYTAMNKWLGGLKGGLAMATVGGCAIFAACTGSSVACATVMVPVSLPEMRKYKYSNEISLGTIAAGGTLGFLIPPSNTMVVYAILAEQSVGKLLLAGILPGLVLAALFILAIYIWVTVKPASAPTVNLKYTWLEKFKSVKDTFLLILLAAFVTGGIWLGVFSVEEAGAAGALAAFFIALGRKRITMDNIKQCLIKTVKSSGMIFTIMFGAMIFSGFVTISKLPFLLADFVSTLALPTVSIIVVILFIYVILGCIMDPLAMIILTVPILLPTLTHLGVNLIWFGVLQTMMVELAVITPPIGVNVFVISGMAKDVEMYTVFKGVLPFVIAMCVAVAIVVAFPDLALIIPNTMRGG